MRRLPTLGEVSRSVREPESRPPRRRRSADSTAGTDHLVALGLIRGDRVIQRLGVLERWQLRPELERILHETVTSHWTEAEVDDLVDLVLRNWGHLATTS